MPDQTLESVFDVPDACTLDDVSRLEALSLQGGSTTQGAAEILLRAAVAALLNSVHPDVDYALTTADAIRDVNEVPASNNRGLILEISALLDDENNRGCTLRQHAQATDVALRPVDAKVPSGLYDSGGTDHPSARATLRLHGG